MRKIALLSFVLTSLCFLAACATDHMMFS